MVWCSWAGLRVCVGYDTVVDGGGIVKAESVCVWREEMGEDEGEERALYGTDHLYPPAPQDLCIALSEIHRATFAQLYHISQGKCHDEQQTYCYKHFLLLMYRARYRKLSRDLRGRSLLTRQWWNTSNTMWAQ